ncbi:zinc-binding dehydrogenase [Halanaerobium sp. Z-7514]|uniref:Zinc-binding dehydrogenase n=1 Tax=Halanaerobium polyolivorans TaxID=2886943 RepID=A0AAW4X1E2_9FIRM|nr:zinc-binding dehydrogenase [Halanaerobium polyolivorans]MCC3145595.1 zinc-binding dehydrogenase [Halanaerobium polyolivorans]
MKIALFNGPKDVSIKETEIPNANPGEIVIKNNIALTCGTDVKTFLRGHPLWDPPAPFGHESAGVVYEVGEGVDDFKKGDRVVAHNSAPCNECYYCKQGQHSMCENMTWNLGAFAEYQAIPANIVKQNVFHIPDNMDFKEAALTEPFACAVYGTAESNIQLGDFVVVNGVGPIGLMFVALAVRKGAHVIATDLSEKRLEKAKKYGAAEVINVKELEDQVKAVRNLTPDNRGVDVAIEAVGLPDVWEKTINMTRKGGIVNLFGGPKPGTSITVDTKLLHYSQLTLKGVFHTTPKYVERAFNLIKDGVIKAEDFVEAEYSLDEIENAILSHKKGEVIKNSIVF